MSERQSVPSGPQLACENGDPADAAFVARLQQAVRVSNENCDRATTLAYALSAELRDAQQRMSELERAADERLRRVRAETKTALARFQADADAFLEETMREADDRVAR